MKQESEALKEMESNGGGDPKSLPGAKKAQLGADGPSAAVDARNAGKPATGTALQPPSGRQTPINEDEEKENDGESEEDNEDGEEMNNVKNAAKSGWGKKFFARFLAGRGKK